MNAAAPKILSNFSCNRAEAIMATALKDAAVECTSNKVLEALCESDTTGADDNSFIADDTDFVV